MPWRTAAAGSTSTLDARGPRRAALLVALALGAVFGLHRIVDPDLLQQVAVGRAILAEPTSIGTSSFTHTYPGYRYIEDKWLASVAVALVEAAGGVDGLMVYQIALAVLAAGAWWFMLRAWGASSAFALGGTALLLVACAFRLESRPDTWSHALLAILIGWTARPPPPRRAFLFVAALMALWVNLHGYFANGWLVLLAVTAAAAVAPPVALLRPYRSPLRAGALLLATAMLATLAHPQGVHAALWPVRQLVLLWREPVLREAIQEFFPTWELLGGAPPAIGWLAAVAGLAAACGFTPLARTARPRSLIELGLGLSICIWPPADFGPWPYRLTLALFVMALVEVGPALRERRPLALLLFGGFGLMALPMVRNLSLVPPVAAILLVPAWTEALYSPRAGATPRRALVAGMGCVVAAVVVLAAWARLADHLAPGTYRHPGWTGWGLAVDRFPSSAAAMVERENLPGELLNNFDTSGYLLYRLHPARAVFIADNTSIYPPSFLALYRREVMAGRIDPRELPRRFGVRTVVLDHAAMETPRLLAALSRSSSWMLVHLDRAAAVFVLDEGGGPGRIGPLDLEAAAKRLAAEPPRRGSLPEWLFPRRRLFPDLNLGIFLRAIGRPDLALGEADRLWRAGPATEIATFTAAAAEEAGRLEGAVPRLEQALASDPRSAALGSWLARALFHRAVGSLADGRAADAEIDLARSAELAPREAGVHLARAQVAAVAGDEAAAREHLREALRWARDDRILRAIQEDPRLGEIAQEDPAGPL